jgi:NAD(P) transhydrogenase subunit alpha
VREELPVHAQLAAMQPGSVVVDMAAGSGGNVEGSVPDQDVVKHGVLVMGDTNLEGRVPYDATQMYGSNLVNLVQHFWNKEIKSFDLRMEDEIIKGSLLTHGGNVVHSVIKERIS